MRAIKNYHREFWTKANFRSLLGSAGLLAVAVAVQKLADNYVTRIKGVPVDDLLLSHLPVWDIDGVIIIGVLVVTLIIVLLCAYKPKYLNFTLKSLSVFIIIRAGLISMTHLGASPHQLVFEPNNFGYGIYNLLYNTNNDFFFSGHTGVPFLIALIFWQEKKWRYFFLICSALSGASVLIAHMHYSIDVFAAPFMTYSIFALCRHFFAKDYQLTRT